MIKLGELNQYKLLRAEYTDSIDFCKMQSYYNLFIDLYKAGLGKHIIFNKRPVFIDIATASYYAPISFSLAFKAISMFDKFSNSWDTQEENPFYFIAIDKNEHNLQFAMELSKKEFLHGDLTEEIWNYICAGSDYGYINDKFSFCNTKYSTSVRNIGIWSSVTENIQRYIHFEHSKPNDIEVPMNWENFNLSFAEFPKTFYRFLEEFKQRQEFTFIVNLNYEYYNQNLSEQDIATFINKLILSFPTNKLLLLIQKDNELFSNEVISKLPDLKNVELSTNQNFYVFYKGENNLLDSIPVNGSHIHFQKPTSPKK